jgi:hypothetical protein
MYYFSGMLGHKKKVEKSCVKEYFVFIYKVLVKIESALNVLYTLLKVESFVAMHTEYSYYHHRVKSASVRV